jgi:hypothetical protein
VFWKLLFRWKGSIYKLVWQNLVVYLVLYSTLSLTYRLLLEGEARVSNFNHSFSQLFSSQTKFEQISVHCQRFADLIPVTFVLGFYVSIVIARSIEQLYTAGILTLLYVQVVGPVQVHPLAGLLLPLHLHLSAGTR